MSTRLLLIAALVPFTGITAEIAEPADVIQVEPRQSERERWSWNAHHATVTETGDLQWTPHAFVFAVGESVRYIDYAGGDDSRAGTSPETAWKHHPWDEQAGGQARGTQGVDTYVFKRGVTYRGSLVARESGRPDQPIRLTSSPDWGTGEAELVGSQAIGGWRRGADHTDIPNGDQVWWVDLDFAPRNVWMDDNGVVTRIDLARIPNWTVSNPDDVLAEWWTWDQPEWWRNHWKMKTPNGPRHLGVSRHFTEDADYYTGAILRTEYGNVMGTPYPTRVEAVVQAEDHVALDAIEHAWARAATRGTKGVVFQGMWFGDSTNIRENHRFFLEDKPHYLDVPGQFWFDRRADGGGRMYLRLPEDRDPNRARVEVARHIHIIQDQASARSPARLDTLNESQRAALDVTGVSHLDITGLTFRFTNTHWDLALQRWGHEDVANAAIRLRGSGSGIRIAHNRFAHVASAVLVAPIRGDVTATALEILDNDMHFTDHGAIQVSKGGSLGSVHILRNRLHKIGMRAYRNSHGHAVTVAYPQTMEIAGNILTRCYGAGILVHGGKASGSQDTAPLSRQLIYNNSAVDTLLAADDWGGIAAWQGGPFYIYNNISGNPGGLKYAGWGRDAPAYYLDGGFKSYLFNNVAWGRPIQPPPQRLLSGGGNDAAIEASPAYYQAVPTIHNQFFNNTAYRFRVGSGWSPAGGRQLFLGNIWHDIMQEVFNHGRQKEDEKAEYQSYPHETIGYARNVFVNPPKIIGTLEGSGIGAGDVERFRFVAETRNLLATDIGEVSTKSPLRDPTNRDFRPVADSSAIDRGVRVFVPWGLYVMVGEWHFRRNRSDPTAILDDHWNMTAYHTERESYRLAPAFHLRGVNIDAASYTAGILEDWTETALTFNGRDQYAVATHAELTAPHTYRARVGREQKELTVSGAEIVSPDIHASNFIVEAVFRSEPGHAGSTLVAKTDGRSGYRLAVNRAGSLTFVVSSDGRYDQMAGGALINKGGWHHVIAEVDRVAGRMRLYVDGQLTSEQTLTLPIEASLSNSGDLLVGKGRDGDHFAGALDFLRIARGTLADAHTSIEELYDWQFDGPFRHDFVGNKPHGQGRDAGAFEYVGD